MNNYVPSVDWDLSFVDPLKNNPSLPFGQLNSILEIFSSTPNSTLTGDGHVIGMLVSGDQGPSVEALYTKIGGVYRKITATADPLVYPELITLSDANNVAVINSMGLVLINANPLTYPPIPGIQFKSFASAVVNSVGDSTTSTSTIFKLSSDESAARNLQKRIFMGSIWSQTGKDSSEKCVMRDFFPGCNLDGSLPNFESPITADNIRAMVLRVPGGQYVQERPPWNDHCEKALEMFAGKYMSLSVSKNPNLGDRSFLTLNQLFLGMSTDNKESLMAATECFFRTRAKMMNNDEWLKLKETFYVTVFEFKQGVRIPGEFLKTVTCDMFYQLASLYRNNEFLRKSWPLQLEILQANFQGKMLSAQSIDQAFTDFLIENPIVSPRIDVPSLNLSVEESVSKKAKTSDDSGKKASPFASVIFCLHHWLETALDDVQFKCGSSKCKFPHESHFVSISKSSMIDRVNTYLNTGSRVEKVSDAQKKQALEFVETCYSTKITGKNARELNEKRLKNSVK